MLANRGRAEGVPPGADDLGRRNPAVSSWHPDLRRGTPLLNQAKCSLSTKTSAQRLMKDIGAMWPRDLRRAITISRVGKLFAEEVEPMNNLRL
jgi:hypothetical protein